MEWCKEWSVEVNVEKSGVMHMRRKGVKRTVERFYVGGKEIGVVEEYKYLGSVVNEYLTNVRMVEERGRAGVKALSDWFRRCRASVGEVKGATFVRLVELFVESVLPSDLGQDQCASPSIDARVEYIWSMARCHTSVYGHCPTQDIK